MKMNFFHKISWLSVHHDIDIKISYKILHKIYFSKIDQLISNSSFNTCASLLDNILCSF